jgi:hypothetical protein
MKLPMNPIPSTHFTWEKQDGHLVTEASQLRDYDGFQRMYDDAADRGMAIVSKRTGKVERFYFVSRHEHEGETTHWEFLPENPECPVKKVVVFND